MLEQGRVHPLGSGVDLLAQVMLHGGPAGEGVQHRRGQQRHAQELPHEGLAHGLGGVVAAQAQGGYQGEGAHPARMLHGGLDGVGRRQARRHDDGLLPHHARQEVRKEVEVRLGPEGSGAAGPPPTGEVGDVDAVTLGQDLGRGPPLLGIVAGTKGVEEEDRRTAAQLLEDHLGTGAAGVAVRPSPERSRGRLGAAAQQGAHRDGDSHGQARQQQTPGPAPSTTACEGPPGASDHGREHIIAAMAALLVGGFARYGEHRAPSAGQTMSA